MFMRILFLTTYFRPDYGANATIMSKLADEFVARGHEVTVLTSVPHYNTDKEWPEYSGKLVYSEHSGSIRIYRVYAHASRDRADVAKRLFSYASFSLFSFLRGLTISRHDVILVPSPPLSNGVIADLIGRLRSVPFVYNVQDIWPDVAIRAGVLKSSAAIEILKRMERYVYRRAAGIAVISDGFRRNLLAKGVPEQKIAVTPNFVDTNSIVPMPKENHFSKRENLGEKFVVLFAGNMGFSQGLETVLDSAKLLQNIHEIEFLLVGNGAHRSSAQAYLASLGLTNARFLPFQPGEDLPAMYGAADVCLIPLRRGFTAESVPSKLFTIMAAGKPTVAAVDPESETTHLIQRSKSGICVEPENARVLADAIVHYYRDSAARKTAGENARRFVEAEFRAGSVAELYLDAMQSAITRRRNRRRGPDAHECEKEAVVESEPR